jgi:flagellar biosynthesis protein FlhB
VNDDGEKAFDPTPQRIARAKREGDIARSAELAANLAFGAAAMTVAGIAPWIAAATSSGLVDAAAGRVPWLAGGAALASALVPMTCAAAGAVGASVLQAGGFHAGSLTMQLARPDPVNGIKRSVSRDTAAHAVRACAAFFVASLAMLPAFFAAASQLVPASALATAAAAAWHACERIAFVAATAGSLFAIAEYAAARGAWLRKLRMSFGERKRESKEQEGDPFARGRRRALHRSLSHGAVAAVKDASFVVVNPVHVAIALAYRPPDVPVPRVLVRAAGEAALRVRALATARGIAVVENAPLARALYRDVRVGHYIARAHFVAVAEIVVALRRAEAAKQ